VKITSYQVIEKATMDEDHVREQRVLSLRELAAQITELAGHLNAANYRWLSLIAEFDRRHGWSDGSTQSCAHWLNWQCGIDLGAAREKVRVAHALEKLPRIAAAMERGELSYSKARALTRVACQKTEEYFLHRLTRHSMWRSWCAAIGVRRSRKSCLEKLNNKPPERSATFTMQTARWSSKPDCRRKSVLW